MKAINNKNHKYILIVIGLTYISYYIWFRFIRLRLPRDMPFELTILGCICLAIICCTYFYIIYRYLKPKVPHPIVVQILSQVSLILKPLYVLDEMLQYNKHYKRIYYKILHILIKKINKLCDVPNKKYYDAFNFFLKFIIFPKIFMLTIFAIDIFYFHKLDYFYVSLFIGLYLIFWRYLIFSAANILEDMLIFLNYYYIACIIYQKEIDDYDYFININSLTHMYRHKNKDAVFGDENPWFDDFDEDFDDPEYPSHKYKYTNVSDFVHAQACGIFYKDTLYEYTCIERPRARIRYNTIHNTNECTYVQEPAFDDISRELAKYFHDLTFFAIDLHLFLQCKDRDTHKDIKKLEIIIIMGYLICWSYILIVSLHTLNILDILELLQDTYKYVEGPFSS